MYETTEQPPVNPNAPYFDPNGTYYQPQNNINSFVEQANSSQPISPNQIQYNQQPQYQQYPVYSTIPPQIQPISTASHVIVQQQHALNSPTNSKATQLTLQIILLLFGTIAAVISIILFIVGVGFFFALILGVIAQILFWSCGVLEKRRENHTSSTVSHICRIFAMIHITIALCILLFWSLLFGISVIVVVIVPIVLHVNGFF